jgi:ABC-type branched-subunit amino acid transport system substrate-binding protein
MQGRRSRTQWWVVAVVALLAAACGAEREDDGSGVVPTSAPPTTTAPAEGSAEPVRFGDLEFPCGPGDAAGATDVGVTDGEIVIGYGDDAGSPVAPGTGHEMSDAIEALVERCNELGGIAGRPIRAQYYDAAVLDVATAVTQACADGVFMLVGQGWALDSQQEELRLECGLASVPAFAVSASFAHAPLAVQPVPNPADQTPTAGAALLAELYPAEILRSAVVYGNFAATQETTAKVLQLRSAGAEAVYFSGVCLPSYQALRQRAAVDGYEPVWFLEANAYEAQCAAANADGAMDRSFIRMVFLPLEEADVVPAVGDYVELLEASGGDRSLLGMQATSAFLLWATAASACGSELTRACVLEQARSVEGWTAGGLHVPTEPGANTVPTCGLLLELVGTTYRRAVPPEPGSVACDPSWVQPVDTPWVDEAMLDEDRVSQRFAGALNGS